MIRNLTAKALIFIANGGSLMEAILYVTRKFRPGLREYYGRIIEQEISAEMGGA